MRLTITHLVVLTCLLPFVAASSLRASSPYLLKEEIAPPRGWVKTGFPEPSSSISLRIALKKPDCHKLDSHLNEISNPNHERYGNHLTKEEVDELSRPHPESNGLIRDWLHSLDVEREEIEHSDSGTFMFLTTSIRKAEIMLNTTYHLWTETDTGVTRMRTTSWRLPEHLHDHVQFIQPTTMFGSLRKSTSILGAVEQTVELVARDPNPGASGANAPGVDPNCAQEVTISCIQQIYGITGYSPLSTVNNSIAVTGYLGIPAIHADLQKFFAEQRPEAQGSDFKEILVNGGTNEQNVYLPDGTLNNIESNMDTQVAFGLTHPISATFYSTGGKATQFKPDEFYSENGNEPYDLWLDYLSGQAEVPWVISTSYADHEQTVPLSYAQHICDGFKALGLRGVSVIVASGDYGVGDGRTDPNTHKCHTNDEQRRHRFIPQFPASCPWVTSVGMSRGINPEIAPLVESTEGRFGTSGGGFSDYFSRPDYQNAAVSGYFAQMPPGQYEGLFNKEGRGIPDVVAQGLNVPIYMNGQRQLGHGASVAAPIFAGIVALLNDARLRNNQPTLGFLNPLFYGRLSAGMNDILSGDSRGCGTGGFSAAPGWDPVTGLGSPNFSLLKDLVLSS